MLTKMAAINREIALPSNFMDLVRPNHPNSGSFRGILKFTLNVDQNGCRKSRYCTAFELYGFGGYR